MAANTMLVLFQSPWGRGRQSGNSLAGKWEGRWLKGVVWYAGMKGHMGSAAGMDVEWDWSTGSSCTRQRMSSLVTEMLLGLMDPFHYSFSYL